MTETEKLMDYLQRNSKKTVENAKKEAEKEKEKK
jgi:hypothetical protein